MKTLEEVMREIERKREDRGIVGLRYWSGYAFYRVRDRVRDVPRQVRWAHQRLFRGWDDRAVWSLDTHLAKTLGAQLVCMADNAHGYPSRDYTFLSWVEELRTHGDALLAYSRHFDCDPNAWEALYEPAQAALRWVAEHFADLWD